MTTDTEEWKIGDIAIHEGREYLVYHVNENPPEGAYHLWTLDVETHGKEGIYEGEAIKKD